MSQYYYNNTGVLSRRAKFYEVSYVDINKSVIIKLDL
jgi:hypothetical protein